MTKTQQPSTENTSRKFWVNLKRPETNPDQFIELKRSQVRRHIS